MGIRVCAIALAGSGSSGSQNLIFPGILSSLFFFLLLFFIYIILRKGIILSDVCGVNKWVVPKITNLKPPKMIVVRRRPPGCVPRSSLGLGDPEDIYYHHQQVGTSYVLSQCVSVLRTAKLLYAPHRVNASRTPCVCNRYINLPCVLQKIFVLSILTIFFFFARPTSVPHSRKLSGSYRFFVRTDVSPLLMIKFGT